jgi:divinyl chlorophyllide a 8-vinyl-reductase
MTARRVALLLASAAALAGASAVAAPRAVRSALVRPAARQVARMTALVPGESCTGERVVVVGATGYIGKAVVKESVRRGYPTKAVLRDVARGASEPKFAGATLVQADVTDPASLSAPGGPLEKGTVDIVVSCLASRSGTKKDSYAIDYQATLNCVEAARAAGARHFVLLSAFCVRSAELNHPYALQFQYAKKELEQQLERVAAEGGLSYTSVRPTAFFKSVSGQLEIVESGAPFVYFDLGDGKCATCNPISEPDLAAALIDCIADASRRDTIWNLGGPDAGMSMVEQGKLIASILGKEKPSLLGVPIGIFDVIVNGLQWVASTFNSEQFEDAAELARIGRYYALEDMLTTEPSERYGKTTLREHYERIARDGQECARPTRRGARPQLRAGRGSISVRWRADNHPALHCTPLRRICAPAGTTRTRPSSPAASRGNKSSQRQRASESVASYRGCRTWLELSLER